MNDISYLFPMGELRPFVAGFQKNFRGLTDPLTFDTIEWTVEKLENILAQRLVIAGAGHIAFNGSSVDIEQHSAEIARNSPRVLSGFICILIKEYVYGGDGSGRFSDEDRQNVRRRGNNIFPNDLLPEKGLVPVVVENQNPASGQSEFDEKLYVKRENKPDSFWTWLEGSDKRQEMLRVVTAPPGYGKTWFAKDIVQQVNKERCYPIYVPVHTFDTKEKILDWLNKAFRNITPPRENSFPDDCFHKFGLLIKGISDSGKYCLLVIDDVSPPRDSEFSEILSQIQKTNRDIEEIYRARVLILGRYPDLSQAWQNVASSGSDTLPVFDLDAGQEQLCKLGFDEAQIGIMKTRCSPYEFGVPHLNKLLGEKYLNAGGTISGQDLWQCIWDAYGDKSFIEEVKEILCELSSREKFTLNDVEEMLKDKEPSAVLRRLMDVQLVHHIKRANYQVVDGWREFFRIEDLCSNAINQMQ